MPTVNQQISAILHQMSAVAEILEQDRFRIIAFQRAARALDDLGQDVAAIGSDVKRLVAIEGIGKGTAQRIAEFLTIGKIKEHEELLAQVPPGLPALLDIPGLGPKTVGLLWRHAGVDGLEALIAKLDTDDLVKLPGLGTKKLENLRKSIAFAQTSSQRIRLGQAMPLAHWFVDKLRDMPGVKEAAYAGSLRRGRETIGDIDLIVAASDSAATRISDAFVELEPVREVLVKGQTKTSVRVDDPTGHSDAGVQVDLRIVDPDHYGAALLYFTGSKELNVAIRERAIKQGAKLNEYGLYKGKKLIAARTEEEVFNELGLAYIPPQLREGCAVVARAEKNELPKLIKLPDIKAELHAHTDASDGRWTIRELAMAAAERGFHTIAVTDHSKSQVIANGLSNQRLEQHIAAIRETAEELKDTITVLAGSEVDILADGKLDYPNALLKELDVVVASPHNALTQDPAKATKRLLKAIDNPYVTIMGHPTGRLINRREGLSPDMGQLIQAAAQRGIAMEINANSWRLDLNDANARAAIAAGVKLAINTDAHGPGDFDQLIFGVLTAQRAGATKNDVVNAMTQPQLMNWLKTTRN